MRAQTTAQTTGQPALSLRQGDVLLLPVPAGRLGQSGQSGQPSAGEGLVILARGETTGHAHYVAALDAAMEEANEAMRALAAEVGVQDARFVGAGLRVMAPTTLWHGTPTLDPAGPRDADHAPLTLPVGDYLVLIPHEYDDTGEFRRVAD